MYRIKGIEVDEFTWAYVEAALWSSNDESDDQGGNPLDQNYGPDDLDDTALQQIIAECKAFKEANAKKIATWGRALYWRGRGKPETTPDEQAGHDFWLTRNGHGVGFWESEWGAPGKRLDAASKRAGECNLYVSDGKIYIS